MVLTNSGEFQRRATVCLVTISRSGCRLPDLESWGSPPEAIEPLNSVNNQMQELESDACQIAEDARALMTATAGVPGEKVSEARKRLATALERTKEIAGTVRTKAVAGAKATDVAVRAHPYQAIAVGVGVGAVTGYLLGRKAHSHKD